MEDKFLDTKPVKPKKKKSIIGIVFTVIILVATLIVIFTKVGDFGATMREIGNAKGTDLIFAALFLLAYILLYPLGLNLLSKGKGLKTKFFDDYLIGASEHFFNGITPYQTGAQPFQIYSYYKKGVKVSDATGMVLVNFLALLIASNVFVIISLVRAADFFAPFRANGTLWIPIIGIIMNFLVLVLFLLVATCKFVRVFLRKCLSALCRIKFIGKHLSKSIPAFDEYCFNAQLTCKEALKDLKTFIPLVLLKLVCLLCYYSIPYFIFRALGISTPYDYFNCVLATAFTVNSVVWIPTPGTSGGIELAFITLFMLEKEKAAAASLLWRGFTYYILMIISALEYAAFEIINKIQNKRKKITDEGTETENQND